MLLQLLRAGTKEMLSRARKEIHPSQRGKEKWSPEVSERKHFCFSFVNKLSCSTLCVVFDFVVLAISQYQFCVFRKSDSNTVVIFQ